MELIGHMDAGDRRRWRLPRDERPLSDLGRRQAECLSAVVCTQAVDGLFSSPALRCRQTLEPIAERYGLSIKQLPGLAETYGFVSPDGWDAMAMPEAYAGAYAAGRAYRALVDIRKRAGDGRVAVCSHGDIVPALASFMGGRHGIDVAAPHHLRRPLWYTLVFEGADVSIRRNKVPEGFPN